MVVEQGCSNCSRVDAGMYMCTLVLTPILRTTAAFVTSCRGLLLMLCGNQSTSTKWCVLLA